MAVRVPVKSALYSYAKITTSSTQYAKKMKFLSDKIFGEVTRPTSNGGMRVVRKFSEQPSDLRPEIVDYYPRHKEVYSLFQQLRRFGLYRDEHEDFKDEMKRQRILRGKGKPKKGQGKRAKK